MQQLDNFWGHAEDILVEATPPSEPVYTYDPHYWFYIARPEIEKTHIQSINAHGKQFLMTVGGRTYLDTLLRNDFGNGERQYAIQSFFERADYYVMIIGDFLLEGFLDRSVVTRIEEIYASSTAHTQNPWHELLVLMTVKGKNKLKITRNRMKARKLKAQLGRNFFLGRR